MIIPEVIDVSLPNRGAPGKAIPWERKETKLFWRGSTTGGHARQGNYKDFHRERLMNFRAKNESLFDVAFTATIQCDFFDCRAIRRAYPFKGRSAMEDNFENKYLLDIVRSVFSSES